MMAGLRLDVVGLDGHMPFSSQPHASRRKNSELSDHRMDAAAAH
jgi:hypothetical protein